MKAIGRHEYALAIGLTIGVAFPVLGCGQAATSAEDAQRCLEARGATVKRVEVDTTTDTDAPEMELIVRVDGGGALIGYFDSDQKATVAAREARARSGVVESQVRRNGAVLIFETQKPAASGRAALHDCVFG